MIRFLFTLLGLILFLVSGCTDRPESVPQSYGKILNELPTIKEAEEPFQFPYAGNNDHRNCEFKDEDFF
jgi:hypothetical protein